LGHDFGGYRCGGKIFNLLTNFYKLVEVKGIYPLFLDRAKAGSQDQ